MLTMKRPAAGRAKASFRSSHRAAMTSFLAVFCIGVIIAASSAAARAPEFVEKRGTQLFLHGKAFRYSGLNIEWLGTEYYGPVAKRQPAFPSAFEVDDALETAADMGVEVVRAQTVGDTVGCETCIEPRLGTFNAAALDHLDEVIEAAKRRHIRLIVPLTGDCSVCVLPNFPFKNGINQYLTWFSRNDQRDFFRDPKLIAAFEKHISAILEHRNHLSGIQLKDDSTIFAWENCNLCTLVLQVDQAGLNDHLTDPDIAIMRSWIEEIGHYLKSTDRHHLYFDNSGLFRFDPTAARLATPDIIGAEYYPHWATVVKLPVTAHTFLDDARLITDAGKVYAPSEVGWDRTNWPSHEDFGRLLTSLAAEPRVSGDSFWALQAHAPDHGWQALPVDDTSTFAMTLGESGEWWALYYTGRDTLVNTKSDMAARAQMLRDHVFAMKGAPRPSHAVTESPLAMIEGRTVLWRGAAGAMNYSIERAVRSSGPWQTVCERCVTDESPGWEDPSPPANAAFYRVTGYNLDGVRGLSSSPVSLTAPSSQGR